MIQLQEGPIGIFDSGVGGLIVLTEVRNLLPSEPITYLADIGNGPYGSKTQDEILFLARKHIDFLLEQNCKLIVIACNTITEYDLVSHNSQNPLLIFFTTGEKAVAKKIFPLAVDSPFELEQIGA